MFLSPAFALERVARDSDKVGLNPSIIIEDCIGRNTIEGNSRSKSNNPNKRVLFKALRWLIWQERRFEIFYLFREPFVTVVCPLYLFPGSSFRVCILNAAICIWFFLYLHVLVHLFVFTAPAAAPVLHFLHLSLWSMLREAFSEQNERTAPRGVCFSCVHLSVINDCSASLTDIATTKKQWTDRRNYCERKRGNRKQQDCTRELELIALKNAREDKDEWV